MAGVDTPLLPRRANTTATSRAGANWKAYRCGSGLSAGVFSRETQALPHHHRGLLWSPFARENQMAVVSMTGFADAQGAFETLRWRWEVRSVNGRSLDLRLRLPPGLESMEAAARTLAAERCRRGNIQATLTLESQDPFRGLKVDPAALAQAVKIAREVAHETGLAPARVDGLLALRGVIVQDDNLGGDAATR